MEEKAEPRPRSRHRHSSRHRDKDKSRHDSHRRTRHRSTRSDDSHGQKRGSRRARRSRTPLLRSAQAVRLRGAGEAGQPDKRQKSSLPRPPPPPWKRKALKAQSPEPKAESSGLALPVEPPEPRRERKFECEHCSRRFFERHDLEQHQWTSLHCKEQQGKGQARSKCGGCGKFISDQPRAWQQHWQYYPECKTAFKQTGESDGEGGADVSL